DPVHSHVHRETEARRHVEGMHRHDVRDSPAGQSRRAARERAPPEQGRGGVTPANVLHRSRAATAVIHSVREKRKTHRRPLVPPVAQVRYSSRKRSSPQSAAAWPSTSARRILGSVTHSSKRSMRAAFPVGGSWLSTMGRDRSIPRYSSRYTGAAPAAWRTMRSSPSCWSARSAAGGSRSL